MAEWPFPHNWASVYSTTISFKTQVLVSQSGREQRIAERAEPRRTVVTQVLDQGPALDRFMWGVQVDTFDYPEPVGTRVLTVRFDEQQTIAHPASGVSVASIALSVEPGTEDPITQEPDAYSSFAGRYVLPFEVNWSAGRDDTIVIPRRTTDFGRGRISVTRPAAFAVRTGDALLLRVGADETDALVAFFSTMRGRQGEFWNRSLLDDLIVLETVSTTVTVDGADADAMYAADTVNAAIALRSTSGNVFYRRVVGSAVSGNTTLLQINGVIPTGVPILTAQWVRLSRFSSDDLTIEWTTSTVAQARVQMQTLPYADPEAALDIDPAIDYFGSRFFRSFADPLDYLVNQVTPKAGEWPATTG